MSLKYTWQKVFPLFSILSILKSVLHSNQNSFPKTLCSFMRHILCSKVILWLATKTKSFNYFLIISWWILINDTLHFQLRRYNNVKAQNLFNGSLHTTIFWKYTWRLFDRIIQCFKNILNCSMVKNNEASLVKNVTLFSKFYDKKRKQALVIKNFW